MIQAWEKKRLKGKLSFVFYDGVVLWGLKMAIFYTVLEKVFFNSHETWAYQLLYSLLTFPVCGFFFGIFIWNIRERSYQKSLKAKLSQ